MPRCTWAYLVVVRWSDVVISPISPSRDDHCIPAMLTHVFLTITHASHTGKYWAALR